MLDSTAANDLIPTLAERLLHDFAQKALTTLATAMMAHGMLMVGDRMHFVEIGVAVVVYAVGCAWTVVAARIRQIREHVLAVS